MDRIQLRRDSSARWAEHNPILLEGEAGYETDTRRRKIGDGVHRWNDLDYLAAENVVQETGDSEIAVMSQKAVTKELTELESIIKDIDIKFINEIYKPVNVSRGDLTRYAFDYIDSFGVWNTTSIGDPSGYLKVQKGWVVNIYSQEDKKSWFTLLSDPTPVTGSAAQYSSGYTGRIEIEAGGSRRVVVEEDGYLWVYIRSTTVNYFPSSILVEEGSLIERSKNGVSALEKTDMGVLIPYKGKKVVIGADTITIPQWSRVYYGRNYLYRNTESDVVINRNTGEWHELVLFDIETKEFSVETGSSTVVSIDDTKVLLFVVKDGKSSLPYDYVEQGDVFVQVDNVKTSVIWMGGKEKIQITDSTITIPAWNRFYLSDGTQIRISSEVVLYHTDGNDYEIVIYNKDTSAISIINAPSMGISLDPNEVILFTICFPSKSCSLSRSLYVTNDDLTNDSIVYLNDEVITTDRLQQMKRVSYDVSHGTSSLGNTPNMLVLLHFSDLHGNVENLERIIEFKNHYSNYISDVIHTGDGCQTTLLDENIFPTVAGADTILNCIGNHDARLNTSDSSDYSATQKECYDAIFAPTINEWGVTQPAFAESNGYCYYYKDYNNPDSTANIRLIVLDCMHYDSAQAQWFADVLADANIKGYAVICANHCPSQSGIAYEHEGNNLKSTFVSDGNGYGESLLAVDTPISAEAVRMVDAAYDVVDDYINNGGEFVCWIAGHTHKDWFGYVNGHFSQLQIICDAADIRDTWNQATRKRGTKSQDAFNIVAIDTASKIVKVLKIGATTDRYMRRKESLCFSYATKELLSNN